MAAKPAPAKEAPKAAKQEAPKAAKMSKAAAAAAAAAPKVKGKPGRKPKAAAAPAPPAAPKRRGRPPKNPAAVAAAAPAAADPGLAAQLKDLTKRSMPCRSKSTSSKTNFRNRQGRSQALKAGFSISPLRRKKGGRLCLPPFLLGSLALADKNRNATWRNDQIRETEAGVGVPFRSRSRHSHGGFFRLLPTRPAAGISGAR